MIGILLVIDFATTIVIAVMRSFVGDVPTIILLKITVPYFSKRALTDEDYLGIIVQ